MIGFSFLSLIVTIAVFIGVRVAIFAILPPNVNYDAASILALVVAVIVINFINAYRNFRRSPNGILRNPAFHRYFLMNTFINMALVLLLNIFLF